MKKHLNKEQLQALKGYGVDTELVKRWGFDDIINSLPPYIKTEDDKEWRIAVVKSWSPIAKSTKYTSFLLGEKVGETLENSIQIADTPVDSIFNLWVWVLENVE